MKNRIQSSNEFGRLRQEKLEKFEKKLGTPLPEEYREYLLEHNGGSPTRIAIVLEGEKEPFTVVNQLFGIHEGPQYNRLDNTYEQLKQVLPADLLAIGDDPGGNILGIRIEGKEKGSIFFWNHENCKTLKLAESFKSFLENLERD